ncbi:zinc finger protein CONSTANS-LIKE 2-like [Zingiber officinale]|uniref:zinc finger protein CONSTANS-LIKE 2-like n=1 Tax=Zingiber officinale TaxID=94328 RepID=UPI001C4C34DF|nr:zinc finger protein CONSTANS-LIKE 2-like [Zingiber officinale]
MIAGFGGPGGLVGARGCDACRTEPSAVYCRADSAFLCGGCDARVHTANRVASRHERVWVCEACTVAPAALACRADDAALCAACDAEVHSANPLARRHHRVPILPLPLAGTPYLTLTEEEHRHHVLEDEAESWLLINTKNCDTPAALFGVDQVDEYLDLVGYNNNACNEIHNQEHQLRHHLSEGVVPSPLCLQTVKEHQELQQQQQQEEGYGLELEYEVSNCIVGFSCADNSLGHSVSFASMDASIVPDTTKTEGLIRLLPCSPLPQMAPQFPIYREAKVLKYREKRKARKFEKIIRYASRKAYAEMRPRIKGRFVKRPDAEHKPSDGSYSIVPSF